VPGLSVRCVSSPGIIRETSIGHRLFLPRERISDERSELVVQTEVIQKIALPVGERRYCLIFGKDPLLGRFEGHGAVFVIIAVFVVVVVVVVVVIVGVPSGLWVLINGICSGVRLSVRALVGTFSGWRTFSATAVTTPDHKHDNNTI
jgi:hypothetical protein